MASGGRSRNWVSVPDGKIYLLTGPLVQGLHWAPYLHELHLASEEALTYTQDEQNIRFPRFPTDRVWSNGPKHAEMSKNWYTCLSTTLNGVLFFILLLTSLDDQLCIGWLPVSVHQSYVVYPMVISGKLSKIVIVNEGQSLNQPHRQRPPYGSIGHHQRYDIWNSRV